MLVSCHKGHIFGGVEKNPYKIWEDDKGKYVEMFWSNIGSFYFDYSDLEYLKFRISDNKKKTYNLAFRERNKSKR